MIDSTISLNQDEVLLALGVVNFFLLVVIAIFHYTLFNRVNRLENLKILKDFIRTEKLKRVK